MPPLLRVFTDKRLWLAILASFLVHLWIVAGSGNWLPDWLDEDTPIEVTLAPPPLKSAPPQPVVAPKPDKPAPSPAIKPPPPMPAPPHQPVAEAPSAPQAETPVQQIAVPEPVVEPVPQALPEPIEPLPPEEPARTPPRKVELEFNVDYQGAGGTEQHRYEMTDDMHYHISSLAQPKGLAALVASDLVQKSEGRVTPRGLVPGSFIYQYGKNESKAQKASFDWAGKNLLMEYGGRKQEAPLQDGAQDILSFMYQFMFVPPLEQFDLDITTGKRIKTYSYVFEGEEEITTGAGKIRSLHIARQGAKGEEKDELWLAPEYFYLPVKIVKTDKDGKTIVRTLNKIRIEQNP